MPSGFDGPFVALAVLCHRIDRQADGTVDIHGIVDGLVISRESPQDPAAPTHPVLSLTAVVMLRAGDVRGEGTLILRGWFPSGAEGPTLARRLFFSDDAPAATLAVQLELELSEAGVYWFDVDFEGRRLTRISLHVVWSDDQAVDPQRNWPASSSTRRMI